MNDWYYYFFSTTSQVLGCFLGLYGLFAVFRIQEIKKEMLGLAETVKDALTKETNVKTKTLKQEKLTSILTECLRASNIVQALGMLGDIDDTRLLPRVNHYRKLYYFHKAFKKKVVNTSILAAVIIVISLLLLIIGQFIPDYFITTSYNEIHITISLIVFLSSVICIFLFISILKKSMEYMHTPDNLTTLRRSKLTTSELVF